MPIAFIPFNEAQYELRRIVMAEGWKQSESYRPSVRLFERQSTDSLVQLLFNFDIDGEVLGPPLLQVAQKGRIVISLHIEVENALSILQGNGGDTDDVD